VGRSVVNLDGFQSILALRPLRGKGYYFATGVATNPCVTPELSV
jgi:hypothetical protein